MKKMKIRKELIEYIYYDKIYANTTIKSKNILSFFNGHCSGEEKIVRHEGHHFHCFAVVAVS